MQATIGCSWNHCTYCDMCQDKTFRARPVEDTLRDLDVAASEHARNVRKLFLADGDALVPPTDTLLAILVRARERFPRLERVSCYAMARNVTGKSDAELLALRDAGLTRLYIGPESGDDVVLKRIAKGTPSQANGARQSVRTARAWSSASLRCSASPWSAAASTRAPRPR
ncbi:MAG: radical SAM protein [Sandaracinaceae bacterium]|nr:radical SAM protein [Sandaracinaceae bacterium]